jgi:6,7-dimethyl-8-ribityllumazine synthase
MPLYEGALTATGLRFGIVASRFNGLIVESLIDGAIDAIVRTGGLEQDIFIARCPGAFEVPQVTRRMLDKGGIDAVIALGAVIRGSTPHFDYVAGQAASGLGHVANTALIPVVFGILTTDTIEQAIERAGTKAGNKGFDAAMAAIEMVNLYRTLGGT